MSTSCNVCTSDFNKSSNIKITCFKCDFECCRKCVKTYVLSKNENAHCMSCKIEWDRKFLTDNMDNLFMTKTYKEHRESVCFDREMGMLQGTQVYVEKAIKLEALKNELKETKTLIADLKLKQINLEREIHIENQTTVLAAKKFVRRCPNGDCLGFLSTSLKCDLCEVFACSECHEIKGKTAQEKESHQCKAEVIESVKMIESDSKPCPTCSSLIFKIEGCFAKDTPILMWDQSVKMSQDIIPGDLLIGDDGEQRQVLDTCSGEDNMYEISQNNGETYVVNSKHTLVLKNEKVEEIEILVEDYLKLSDTKKKLLYGFKSSNGINYPAQDISFDPYILGLWLGDGTHTLPIIASDDIQIQQYVLNWCKNNNAELIHDEAVKFRIRRKGNTNGISTLRDAIGQSNSASCKGCKHKKMEICDLQEVDTRSIHPGKTNPFNQQLVKYNLMGNKHIPQEYMMNTREIRLKLLAGLLDTDGSSSNDGKRICIGQVNKRLADQIFLLSHSLGFVVNKTTVERKNVKCPGVEPKDYQDNHIVTISGANLSEIPTILPRKKCKDSNANKDYQKTSISVKLLGKGTYYGWRLDGNHRFIAPDFTVLRNCHQMYCVCCHTAFDWQTLRIETGQIHNPEYFEYLRKKGSLERNPDEVLCGRELDHHLYLKVLARVSNENYLMQEQLQNIMEKAMHIRFEEQPHFRRDRLNDNIDLRIMYMRKQIDKDKFKMLLQKREKESSKCNEIHNVLVMFTNCLTEILYRIQPNTLRDNLIECDELRKYTNECLTRISKTYKSKEYVINRLYNFT